ncbi:hypothetical protein ACEWY4_008490 [Coilia grayii]|uniref:Uncharacterized protein n=1 Tax=Coilia grayii TaxID=363190 RepID=A0ABD1KB23_9TELE
MDSSRSLAQVIMQLQNEIKKLETENKALRGELRQGPVSGPEEEQTGSVQKYQNSDSGDNTGHINLRRNVSAPVLEGQLNDNVMMTVRRYSVSSNILNLGRKHDASQKAWRGEDKSSTNHSRWARLQEGVHGRPQTALSSAAREELSSRDKINNRRSLQDYVNKNRSKVKTVTFLLPVDDIYTNQPVATNRSSEETSCENPVMEDSSG